MNFTEEQIETLKRLVLQEITFLSQEMDKASKEAESMALGTRDDLIEILQTLVDHTRVSKEQK